MVSLCQPRDPNRNRIQNEQRQIQTRYLPSASASREELDELVGGHVEKLVEIDASEAELPERPPLRLPRGHVSIHVRLQTRVRR